MRPAFYTFLFLLCTLLGAGYAPTPVTADDSFRPGQVIRYEGTTRISQTVGEGQPQGDAFKCTLLTLSETSSTGKNSILAIRELVPAGKEGSPVASYDILDLKEKSGLKSRETPMELEASHQMVGIYLPLRVRMPELAEGKPRYEVMILNQIPVSIKCGLEPLASGIAIRNTEKASFDFRGSKATLNKWEERYTNDKKTGVIGRIAINYEMSVSINNNLITLSLDCDLQAKEITTLKKTPTLKKGLAVFENASAAFAGMKASSQTRPLVDEVSKLLDDSPWSALARAARTQHQGFVETFEADDAGKVLAKILGKKAPDFTLADLKGKQVNFSKETAGKVTLLSFWGYG